MTHIPIIFFTSYNSNSRKPTKLSMNKSFRLLTRARHLISTQTDTNLPRFIKRSQLKYSNLNIRQPFSSSVASSGGCITPGKRNYNRLLNSGNIVFCRQFHLEKYSQVGEAMKEDQIREQCGKEACDYDRSKRVIDHILPHILSLYARPRPEDFEIYAPHATFEDPLMRANGVKQIKSAFYSIPKVFSESRIVDYTIKENVLSPGKTEILIDNRQYYKFLGKDINMISLIRLYTEDGKIVCHEDWWDKKPLSNRETLKLPLLGRVTEATRRVSMLATHALMGFGKDPTP